MDRLVAFGAINEVKSDPLALNQSPMSLAGDVGVVDKDIGPALAFDEAPAPLVMKKLDPAFNHFPRPQRKKSAAGLA